MTTREAARPLRRYMRARVRAASLAPTYTITRDVTKECHQTGGQNAVRQDTLIQARNPPRNRGRSITRLAQFGRHLMRSFA